MTHGNFIELIRFRAETDEVLAKIYKMLLEMRSTLRLLLLAGTNFSVLVVCCIWQVFILAFLR